ncbi:cupin domain-containing protein [Rhodoblastus sp.]|uniref:cupin domain-containing protein n=1 Tax=Rhodoblastus sp. TaxID=1962975 RepID=UPI00260C238A|nr:cupin domain-containing protein [Rhodoblastus sp.]
MAATDKIFYFNGDKAQMELAPIQADWIIDGAPVARNCLLSQAQRGGPSSILWDCTTGVFNWHYDAHESIFVLEGAAVVRDAQGVEHKLRPGDHTLFPAGTRAVWRVDSYIRKVAFLDPSVPHAVMLPLAAWRALARKSKLIWGKISLLIACSPFVSDSVCDFLICFSGDSLV